LTAFPESNHVLTLFHLITHLIMRLFSPLKQAFLHRTQPSRHSIVLSTVVDLTRSKTDLIAENALLRQQLINLHSQVKKPSFTQSNCLWLVLLASRLQNWKETPSSSNLTHFCAGIAKAFGCFGNSIAQSRQSPQTSHKDHRLDPTDGAGESSVGYRTHSR
jgi:hypothetical protein